MMLSVMRLWVSSTWMAYVCCSPTEVTAITSSHMMSDSDMFLRNSSPSFSVCLASFSRFGQYWVRIRAFSSMWPSSRCRSDHPLSLSSFLTCSQTPRGMVSVLLLLSRRTAPASFSAFFFWWMGILFLNTSTARESATHIVHESKPLPSYFDSLYLS